MIERREPTFLMTPAQHREWARLLHAKGRPDKARRHEELARAIEIVERRRQAEASIVASPPIAPAT
jgi:hypothetical protein